MPKQAGSAKKSSSSATFFVRIMFRQHASWQGEIEWFPREGLRRKRFFRSLLEMVSLMQEVMNRDERMEADDQLRSWNYNEED